MTAVAPPPNVHTGPRSWNGGAQGGLDSMGSEIYMPRSKASQRYSMPPSPTSENGSMMNGGWVTSLSKKKASRTASTGGLSNGNGWPKTDVRTSGPGPIPSQSPNLVNGIRQPGPILPSQHLMGQIQPNGQPLPSYLMLIPLNATFERKQIPLPYFPDTLRIGRQTNAKTIPTPTNGYFDSKVLSRQHAEVWADKSNNKVWIRDIKSSNGTFVNGQRLSQENMESGPHELQAEDMLELGIDIIGEDNKTIVHHKVAARVEHAGMHAGNFDLNFGDMDPMVNGGPPSNQGSSQNGMRGRNGSQNSRGPATNGNGAMGPGHRQAPIMMSPITMEMVVKKLNHELYAAKQQSQDIQRTAEIFDVFLASAPVLDDPKHSPESGGQGIPQMNGVLEPKSLFSASQINPAIEPSRADTPDAQPSPRSPKSERLSKVDPPQQMLSLVGELARARKEVETNSARIQDLEDALKKERHAREAAEDRAAQLESTSRLLRGGGVKSREPSLRELENEQDVRSHIKQANKNEKDDPGVSIDSAALESASALQSRMQGILKELAMVKKDMRAYKQRAEAAELRAEAAEKERDSDNKTLVETIRALRREEDERLQRATEQGSQTDRVDTNDLAVQVMVEGRRFGAPPGIMRADTCLAVAGLSKEQTLLLRKQTGVPYASVLGVVLLGVGLMAVINNWQRGER